MSKTQLDTWSGIQIHVWVKHVNFGSHWHIDGIEAGNSTERRVKREEYAEKNRCSGPINPS